MTTRRGRVTFPEYANRWRASREFTWEIETRRRIPGNITHHLNPAFPGPIRAITTTDVLEWISRRLTGMPATPRSSMKLYYDLFRTIMNSAEIDGLIRTNPCRAIKTAAAFRGLTIRHPRPRRILPQRTQRRLHRHHRTRHRRPPSPRQAPDRSRHP